MTLHFAYGSNMSTALMQARCRTARPLGPAELRGWRFLITSDGYASIASSPGGLVHGVTWLLRPRDLAALNAYESINTGLYRRRMLPVTLGGRSRSALVYIGRTSAPGRPQPGYLPILLAAAEEWKLPAIYVDDLRRWAGTGCRGAWPSESGEVA